MIQEQFQRKAVKTIDGWLEELHADPAARELPGWVLFAMAFKRFTLGAPGGDTMPPLAWLECAGRAETIAFDLTRVGVAKTFLSAHLLWALPDRGNVHVATDTVLAQGRDFEETLQQAKVNRRTRDCLLVHRLTQGAPPESYAIPYVYMDRGTAFFWLWSQTNHHGTPEVPSLKGHSIDLLSAKTRVPSYARLVAAMPPRLRRHLSNERAEEAARFAVVRLLTRAGLDVLQRTGDTYTYIPSS